MSRRGRPFTGQPGVVVQALGECLLEMARDTEGSARLGFAGDTYNTAYYLSHVATRSGLDLDVRFLSATGDDRLSLAMRRMWAQHGVGDDGVILAGLTVAAYLVDTDDAGERYFTYWRSESAAARLLAGTEWVAGVAGDVIYLSGITLQLLSRHSHRALVQRLQGLRAAGSLVVFDSNYRAAGWPSQTVALAAMSEVLAVTDIALVTLEDELALGGCEDLISCVARLRELGVAEGVVKLGGEGVTGWAEDEEFEVATTRVCAVDTTAAGDSFNGGYLAGRLSALAPKEAARLGNAVAGWVVGQRGAISVLPGAGPWASLNLEHHPEAEPSALSHR